MEKLPSPSPRKPPCGACKFMRQKCQPDCEFAPYFPNECVENFALIMEIYGGNNLLRLLREVSPEERPELVRSLLYEAWLRKIEPIYGSPGLVYLLRTQLSQVNLALDDAREELATYIGTDAMLVSAEKLAPQQQQQDLIMQQIMQHQQQLQQIMQTQATIDRLTLLQQHINQQVPQAGRVDREMYMQNTNQGNDINPTPNQICDPMLELSQNQLRQPPSNSEQVQPMTGYSAEGSSADEHLMFQYLLQQQISQEGPNMRTEHTEVYMLNTNQQSEHHDNPRPNQIHPMIELPLAPQNQLFQTQQQPSNSEQMPITDHLMFQYLQQQQQGTQEVPRMGTEDTEIYMQNSNHQPEHHDNANQIYPMLELSPAPENQLLETQQHPLNSDVDHLLSQYLQQQRMNRQVPHIGTLDTELYMQSTNQQMQHENPTSSHIYPMLDSSLLPQADAPQNQMLETQNQQQQPSNSEQVHMLQPMTGQCAEESSADEHLIDQYLQQLGINAEVPHIDTVDIEFHMQSTNQQLELDNPTSNQVDPMLDSSLLSQADAPQDHQLLQTEQEAKRLRDLKGKGIAIEHDDLYSPYPDRLALLLRRQNVHFQEIDAQYPHVVSQTWHQLARHHQPLPFPHRLAHQLPLSSQQEPQGDHEDDDEDDGGGRIIDLS